MKVKEYPNQDFLKELFKCIDGRLVYINDGKVIHTSKTNGYTTSRLIGENYLSHRLIWIWHNGAIPEDLEIDHIDRVRDNNKIDNLRIVTHQENMFNTNADGYSFNSNIEKWVAQIKINGIVASLGSYDTEEKAKSIYNQAKAEILDTLRHYRETGKVLENELVNLVVLDRYNILVKLNNKWVFSVENIDKTKMLQLTSEYVGLGYSVETIKVV